MAVGNGGRVGTAVAVGGTTVATGRVAVGAAVAVAAGALVAGTAVAAGLVGTAVGVLLPQAARSRLSTTPKTSRVERRLRMLTPLRIPNGIYKAFRILILARGVVKESAALTGVVTSHAPLTLPKILPYTECHCEGVLMSQKRTYQPRARRRARVHGFIARMRDQGGRNVLKRRRLKGRHHLTVGG